MKKRSREILFLLMDVQKFNTISSLAKQFHVSERTIRNDIHEIDDFLVEQHVAPLQMKENGELMAVNNAMVKDALDDISDLYTYKLSRSERQMMIKIILIQATSYTTLSSIADRLFVSRVTVNNDLEPVKQAFVKNHLKVGSYSNKGLMLEGSEGDRRKYLLALISSEYIGTNGQSILLDILKEMHPRLVMSPEQVETVKQILIKEEHTHGNYLTDKSFDVLTIYLLIALTRIKEGFLIKQTIENNLGNQTMGAAVMNDMAQYFAVEITTGEICFLEKMLESLQYTRREHRNEMIIKLQLQTRHFIERVSQKLKINLNHDFEFYQNLSGHIESVLMRNFDIGERNSVVESIVQKHPLIFKAVNDNIGLFEKPTGHHFNDDELGYIVVHVCAALERLKKKDTDLHVLVVCGGGVGTSQLLMAKLKNRFDFAIIDTAPAHNLEQYGHPDTDLIISTIPLDSPPCDAVVVNPLFTDEDYLKISQTIDKVQKHRKKHAQPALGHHGVNTLIACLDPVFEQNGLADSKIKTDVYVAIRTFFDGPDTKKTPALYELLTSAHITLDVSCYSWRDAIRQSAKKLLLEGVIEERYIDAMIANAVENGPYFVLSDGFAMPHEGYNAGCNKMAMNLIRLSEPVDFSELDDEVAPVEFVCCLSTVDHEQHMRAFFHLANLLTNPDFKEALRQAPTSEAMNAAIKDFEMNMKENEAND